MAKPTKVKNRKHPYTRVANWGNKLKGIPCFIIGNAPSLNKAPINTLENYFTIGINRSFFKIDTTILFWQDLALWLQEKKAIKKLKALKFCRSAATTKKREDFYHWQLIGRKYKLTTNPANMYGRGSSGALAFQLAYALGCDPIVLVGMDCRKDKKTGITDFYGNNAMHRSNTLPNCVNALKWIKDCGHGRTLINCSKNKVFEERISVEEAIENFKLKPYTREKLLKKLLSE